MSQSDAVQPIRLISEDTWEVYAPDGQLLAIVCGHDNASTMAVAAWGAGSEAAGTGTVSSLDEALSQLTAQAGPLRVVLDGGLYVALDGEGRPLGRFATAELARAYVALIDVAEPADPRAFHDALVALMRARDAAAAL